MINLKKTLLLKEKGYSQVKNAIFQLINFSFLVNVSVIIFFPLSWSGLRKCFIFGHNRGCM